MADLTDLLDKAFETLAPGDLVDAPVDALQGVSAGDAVALRESLNIRSIGDLARNKYVLAAQHIVALAEAPVETFEQRLARIQRELGLPGMNVDIDEARAMAHQASLGGQRGFFDALILALRSWASDGSDIESPLGLCVNEWGEGEGLRKAHEFLNRSTARVVLLTGRGDGQPMFPPEHGEDPTELWAFALSISDLSDHLHWAIVPTATGGRVYNYGFN